VDVLRIYKPAEAAEESVIGTGLKAGEMVISEGQLRLMPGAKVTLLKPEGQAANSGGAAAGQS